MFYSKNKALLSRNVLATDPRNTAVINPSTTIPIPDSGGSALSPVVKVSDWTPYEKNTLRGFFSVHLPSGIVFHRIMLHAKGDSRWIAFPSREWVDSTGERQFARFVDFRDRATSDKFRDMVLAALDAHIAEVAQ